MFPGCHPSEMSLGFCSEDGSDGFEHMAAEMMLQVLPLQVPMSLDCCSHVRQPQPRARAHTCPALGAAAHSRAPVPP